MPEVVRRGPGHLNSNVSNHSEVPIHKMGVIFLDKCWCEVAYCLFLSLDVTPMRAESMPIVFTNELLESRVILS